MIRMIEVARVSRLAVITASFGLSVQLLAIPVVQRPGDQSITPAVIGSHTAIPAPSVQSAAAAVVSALLIPSTSDAESPDVRPGYVTAKPTHIAASVAVAMPSLTVGDASVKPELIGMTSGFRAPSVAAGAALVGPAGIASGAALPSPIVIPGAASVKPTVIGATSVVASPLMVVGSVGVVPAIVTGTSTVTPPAVSVASSYDPDAQAVFNAMTVQPTATRKGLYNDLVVGGKSDGWWQLLDWMLLFAAHDPQAGLVNLTTPTKVAGAVNSPAFTTDRGYTGDGASSYISLGESYGAGGKYRRDDATMGVWVMSALTASQQQMGGGASGALLISMSSIGVSWRINITTASSTSAQPSRPTRGGHVTATRTATNATFAYTNGANEVAGVTNSTSGNVTTAIGSVLLGSSSYSPDRAVAAYSGASLTAAQIAALHSRLNTYLTAIGAA